MKRGPYKLYLDRYADGAIPKTTFYKKLKKLKSSKYNILNENDHTRNKIEDDISKGSFASSCEADISANTFLSPEDDPEDQISPFDKENTALINIDQNSWLYEDYHDEIQEDEIWFDAEDSLQYQYIRLDNNDEVKPSVSQSTQLSLKAPKIINNEEVNDDMQKKLIEKLLRENKRPKEEIQEPL